METGIGRGWWSFWGLGGPGGGLKIWLRTGPRGALDTPQGAFCGPSRGAPSFSGPCRSPSPSPPWSAAARYNLILPVHGRNYHQRYHHHHHRICSFEPGSFIIISIINIIISLLSSSHCSFDHCSLHQLPRSHNHSLPLHLLRLHVLTSLDHYDGRGGGDDDPWEGLNLRHNYFFIIIMISLRTMG